MTADLIDTVVREQRAGDERDPTAGISDEELVVALRAAGASAEDVQRYLDMDAKRLGKNA